MFEKFWCWLFGWEEMSLAEWQKLLPLLRESADFKKSSQRPGRKGGVKYYRRVKTLGNGNIQVSLKVVAPAHIEKYSGELTPQKAPAV